jgi:acyl-CoA synthetase (AMP-forming)/AMP-acid ligase II
VFGRPHPHWGEAVHAVVTLKPGAAIEPQAILDHSRDRIAHYKCPRSLEIRIEPMPLSGANKIMKAELKAELLARATGPEDAQATS